MTLHPLLVHPDEALRRVSQDVPVSDLLSKETTDLIRDLKETMVVENGVGVAAPQIGIFKRIIVVETSEGPQAFLNPRIVRHSIRKVESEEGCFSVRGVYGIVQRYRSVVVEAYNELGEEVTIQADHLPAIVFQHEIDHLNGVLFIDKVIRYTSRPKM